MARVSVEIAEPGGNDIAQRATRPLKPGLVAIVLMLLESTAQTCLYQMTVFRMVDRYGRFVGAERRFTP